MSEMLMISVRVPRCVQLYDFGPLCAAGLKQFDIGFQEAFARVCGDVLQDLKVGRFGLSCHSFFSFLFALPSRAMPPMSQERARRQQENWGEPLGGTEASC
jgi:hypothetical protein